MNNEFIPISKSFFLQSHSYVMYPKFLEYLPLLVKQQYAVSAESTSTNLSLLHLYLISEQLLYLL